MVSSLWLTFAAVNTAASPSYEGCGESNETCKPPVYVEINGRIVQKKEVADFSSSANTDGDKREFHIGCLWTYRTMSQLCHGSECHSSEILAHDYQRKLWAYFNGDKDAEPPLDEAHWVSFMDRDGERDQMLGMLESCPGMLITSLYVVATSFAFTMPNEAEKWAQRAQEFQVYLLSEHGISGEEFDLMLDTWPVEAAMAEYQFAVEEASKLAARPGQRRSNDARSLPEPHGPQSAR